MSKSTHDPVVLGIDLGSTWCKAEYLDRRGRVIAQGRASTRGAPPFAFDAASLEMLWMAITRAVQDASARLQSPGALPAPAAIGVCSRNGIGLWLDAGGQAVGIPALMAPRMTPDDIWPVYESAAWKPADLCTFAPMLVNRSLWLRHHLPERWARVRRAGSLHDWVLLRLTGRWATNPATGPGRLVWPDAVPTLLGLPATAFPEVVDFDASVGSLTRQAAVELHLPSGIPIVGGYHDGAAATVGTGAREQGDACVTLGTSTALRVVARQPAAGWFGYPITQDRWAWMRGVSQAMADVDRVVTALGGAGREALDGHHARLMALAAKVPPGAAGLSLPIGAGDLDVAVTAARAAGYGPGAIYRAALEGVAWGIRDLTALAQDAGLTPRRYVVTGGGSRNRLLVRILSAILAMPVAQGDSEAGVRGAALAAAVGAGWYPTVAAATLGMCEVGKCTVASPSEIDLYGGLRDREEVPVSTPPWPFWRCLPT